MKNIIALLLCLALLPALAACNKNEKPPFADTLYIDYITPEDEVYAREPELEAAAASLLRDAIPGAPDISVNLRRRERFGPVDGEPAPDGEIVLAPRMNAQGKLDFDALARDIARGIAEGLGLGAEVVAALGGMVNAATTAATTTSEAADVVTTILTTQATATQTTTTTQKTTTTAKKTPDKYTPPQTLIIGENIKQDDIHALTETVRILQEHTQEQNPKTIKTTNEYGDWYFRRTPYDKSRTYYEQGLTINIWLDKKRDGSANLIQSIHQGTMNSVNHMFTINLLLEPSAKAGGTAKSFSYVPFGLRDPAKTENQFVTDNLFDVVIHAGDTILPETPRISNYQVYQYNGSSFVPMY